MPNTPPSSSSNTNTATTTEHAEWQVQRDAAKAAGDAAFRTGDMELAIQHYSQGLSLDPESAVMYSNRSAAYLKSSQKSKALHDAQECVKLGTMGVKGISRLAAALQSLGRYEQASEEWNKILTAEPDHAVAKQGLKDCIAAITIAKEQEEKEKNNLENTAQDDLDDFFNEVEEATEKVKRDKLREAEEVASNAIKNQKKDLGSAASQIDRLLQPNYKWRNLNPFLVLDLTHHATHEEISKRYKALSLLLHPDKNRDNPRAQEAYDQVLKAKAMLDDENKASHVRQLCEQGAKQGKAEWERKGMDESLEKYQTRAILGIFAHIEQTRREVEARQRNQEQRERQQEAEQEEKERNERNFDKQWKQEDRVEKRIGNWRDFQKKKTKKE